LRGGWKARKLEGWKARRLENLRDLTAFQA